MSYRAEMDVGVQKLPSDFSIQKDLALPPPAFAPSPPVLRVHNCTVARGTIVCTILYRGVVLQVVELYSQSSTIHLKWNHSQTKVPGEQTHAIC